MSEPIKPPEPGQVLRVRRWPDVFETSKSRGYGSLTWISVPNSFDSTGFISMCAEFDGLELSAVYGSWQALLVVVSRAPRKELRGYLCGDRGQLYNTKMLSVISRLCVEGFELLIPWAIKEGWLEWAQPGEPYLTGGPQTFSSTVAGPPPVSVEAVAGTAEEPNTPPAPEPAPPEPEPASDWLTITGALQAQGVNAAAKAVKTAQANGWTVEHGCSVVAFARDRPGAFDGFKVYNRWQLAADVPPDQGWPEPSKEFQKAESGRKKAAALTAGQDAEKQRRRKAAAAAAAERAAGGVSTMGETLTKRRAKMTPSTGPEK